LIEVRRKEGHKTRFAQKLGYLRELVMEGDIDNDRWGTVHRLTRSLATAFHATNRNDEIPPSLIFFMRTIEEDFQKQKLASSNAAASNLPQVRKPSSNEDNRGVLRPRCVVWQFGLGDKNRGIDERG
jgi:hypothetical protein